MGPPPVEHDPFVVELMTEAFADWVDEQTMRSGRFHCGHDIRIDFPFDDNEYMAFWAAQNCNDWDLYLTVVSREEDFDKALAYAGAEPSLRRGCYEGIMEGVNACEVYMPHGGSNFGLLFQGGFHAIWYEYEWVYNPAWESWFGDW